MRAYWLNTCAGPNVTVGAEGHEPSVWKECVVSTVVAVDSEVLPPRNRLVGALLGHGRPGLDAVVERLEEDRHVSAPACHRQPEQEGGAL